MNESRNNALPCIRCGKQLRQIGGKDPVEKSLENQPYNGTAFYTSGHYGSTVFDSIHGETIEINVCDICLLEAAERQHVLSYRRITRPEWTKRQFWEPDVDTDRVREIDRREHGGE